MSQTNPAGHSARATNIRKLNRATAVAVSLSAVAFLGVGSGLALATAVDAKDTNANNSLPSSEGGSTRQLPQRPDDSDGRAGESDGFWEIVPPTEGSAPNDGFAQGPNSGSHGNSDMS